MVNKTKQVKKLAAGGPVKRTVAGGLLGATIGYLANPKTAKKLLTRVDSQNVKEKGVALGSATKKTVKNLKTKTADLLKKDKNSGANGEDEQDSETYEKLAEENKALHERLRLLEEKMEHLSEDGGQTRKKKKKSSKEKAAKESKSSEGKKNTEAGEEDTTVSSDDDTVAS